MNQQKNACRLCLQDKKLIKAHIIPEGFYRLLRDGNIAPEMHSNAPGSFPKRMQVGTYDPTILCSECDQKMAPWDDYGQQVLIHRFTQAVEVTLQGKTIAWSMENVEYRRLKLFFMSILWRASVSKQMHFKLISLGPFENQLRMMIRDEALGDMQDFAIVLARFEESKITAMLGPYPVKLAGINYCNIGLPGFVAYIKVDKRPTPTFLKEYYFQEDQPLIVLAQSLQNSAYGQAMREMAESALAHKAKQKGSVRQS